MVKSVSMMSNVIEICSQHRVRMYGTEASSKDFKDSFIVNNVIEAFKGKPEDLLIDEISEIDEANNKASKSLNFRSNCYQRLTSYAKTLNMQEAEICRRILYYMLFADVKNATASSQYSFQLASIKSKATLLQKQIESSLKILSELMQEIDSIEGAEKNGRFY